MNSIGPRLTLRYLGSHRADRVPDDLDSLAKLVDRYAERRNALEQRFRDQKFQQDRAEHDQIVRALGLLCEWAETFSRAELLLWKHERSNHPGEQPVARNQSPKTAGLGTCPESLDRKSIDPDMLGESCPTRVPSQGTGAPPVATGSANQSPGVPSRPVTSPKPEPPERTHESGTGESDSGSMPPRQHPVRRARGRRSTSAESRRAAEDPVPAESRAQTGEANTFAVLRHLLGQASGGDPNALQALREALDADPAFWRRAGDLGAIVIEELIKMASGNSPGMIEVLRRKTAEMREELEGPKPTLLIKMAVDRVLATWLNLAWLELTRPTPSSEPIPRDKWWLKRHREAERQHAAALLMLKRLEGRKRRQRQPAVHTSQTD